MSTLYLLRVRPEFRYREEEGSNRTICIGAGTEAFISPERAQEWARGLILIQFNPFSGFWEDEEFDHELTMSSQNDNEGRTITRSELNEFIASIGLSPPVVTEDGGNSGPVWVKWWDQHASHMSIEQKAKVWLFLVKKPFVIEIVELEP